MLRYVPLEAVPFSLGLCVFTYSSVSNSPQTDVHASGFGSVGPLKTPLLGSYLSHSGCCVLPTCMCSVSSLF